MTEKVRAQLSSAHRTVSSGLDFRSRLGRHLFSLVQPVPDVSLLDATGAGQRGLASADIDSTGQGIGSHLATTVDQHENATNISVALSTNRFGEYPDKGFCTLRGMKTFGERLAYTLDLSGLSQSELARRVGVKPQSIQAITSGRVKSSVHAPRMAKVLGVPLEWLLEGVGEKPTSANPTDAHAVAEAHPAPDAPRFAPSGPNNTQMIPIRSAARGGSDQIMFMDDPVGYTRRPGNLDGVVGAYAIYMVGDSMVPRYEPGWLLHVNPHKPAKPGRCVVVTKKNDAVLVKLLAGKRSGKVELQSINPEYPDTLVIDETEIRDIHVIVGSDEEG